MTVNPKEKLVKSLGEIHVAHNGKNLSYTMKRWELELVADFIIEDRKIIVAPLVNLPKSMQSVRAENELEVFYQRSKILSIAIDQTLINSGIELERN